jgi:hypothetical protein
MKIFLSWAGLRSKHVAVTLKTFLKRNLQALEPWISVDIEKGEVWDESIHNALRSSKAGIICLTSDSINSKYCHYEAGAIGVIKNAKVFTFLYEVEHTEIKQPLSRFQHTIAEKDDMLKLLQVLNKELSESKEVHLTEKELEEGLDFHWPWLVTELIKTPITGSEPPKRTIDDMVKEIVESVRTIDNTVTLTKNFLLKNDVQIVLEKLDSLAREDTWAFSAVCNRMLKLHQEHINNADLNYKIDYSPRQVGFSGIVVVPKIPKTD